MIDAEEARLEAFREKRPGLERGRVIGLPVMAGGMTQVTGTIVGLARGGAPATVCVANVHMLTTARAEPALRGVLDRASMVVSDGMPLVWLLRRQGLAAAEQVRGPDLFVDLCRAAADAGLPVYLYGGDEALIAKLTARLRARFPALRIAGAEAPPVLPARPALDPAVVERIRASGARLVFVGLGCPKQEFWMEAHRPHLDAVQVGVGQAFTIAAGAMREAPPWMRRRGLEWLYRLYQEPRRLWRRYLVTNSRFAGFVLGERLGAWRHRLGPPRRLPGG